MATKYAVASGDWSATATWSDTDGGGGGATVPADGDAVYISAGVNVKMDVDQSAFTGLLNVIIRGGATPGMLYWSNGDSGYLKIRTGYSISGTLDTNRGRILANSDGTWAGTTALQFTDKAVISLVTTARIDASNLDIRLYCTQPTNKYVHTYGTKYEFNAATAVDPSADTIDLGVTPPTAGTAVMLVPLSGATLPEGLYENAIYYVRSVSGTTCKLAGQSMDTTICDITADGSGTIAMLTGYASGSATVNVLEDVTADTGWTNASDHNRVTLSNISLGSYDQQRLLLSSFTSTSATLSATVDSAQTTSSLLTLISRNVSIRSSCVTAVSIIDFGSSTHEGCVFQCEINSTAGTGTTFYGYGVDGGVGHTISGTICGASSGIYEAVRYSGPVVISACSNGVNYGNRHTLSGAITGCANGLYNCEGCGVSGLVAGCSGGVVALGGNTISGSLVGCSNAFQYTYNCRISGQVASCNNGIYVSSGFIVSGLIINCSEGIQNGSGHYISGEIKNNEYGIEAGGNHVITGKLTNNRYDYSFNCVPITIKSGGYSTLFLYARNVIGRPGRISWEDYNGVSGASKAIANAGDILKTACDGTGDAPSQDPDGGSGYCIEASNIQSNCYTDTPLGIFTAHRLWLASGSHTITYKVQTTYAGISAGGLKLTCRYISDDSPLTNTDVTHAPAISQRSSASDWTQTLYVTFTQATAGWVECKMELMEYESGNEVYVWPKPTVT